jgi:Fe-S-cluster containining protein
MSTDSDLVHIMDAATADAARRSGTWLRCRPGCTQCCIGAFAISQLDADRLRAGLSELAKRDPMRAAAVRRRSRDWVERLSPEFPGDPSTGILDESEPERFEAFANDEPCPVLDPAAGTCDLYAFRPATCRVFGPPVRSEGGIGICELNFVGAGETEILAAELHVEWSALEDRLNQETEARLGRHGNTTVAFAIAME